MKTSLKTTLNIILTCMKSLSGFIWKLEVTADNVYRWS